MKQKDVLTKNNDLLNVMFHGTPCSISGHNRITKTIFKHLVQIFFCIQLHSISEPLIFK